MDEGTVVAASVEEAPEEAAETNLTDRIAAEVARALDQRAEVSAQQELREERERRAELERLLKEATATIQHERQRLSEAELERDVRGELSRLGVGKVDLAWRAIRHDLFRSDDGRTMARTAAGEEAVSSYLQKFVQENPELMPARLSGGSGTVASRNAEGSIRMDLNAIRPGMSAEDLDRARKEVARLAAQAFRPQY